MRVRSRARPCQTTNQGDFALTQACFFGYFLCVKESNSPAGATQAQRSERRKAARRASASE